MGKGTTIEKAICVMNATAIATVHISTKTFRNWLALLNKNGTKGSLDTLLIKKVL